MARIINIIIGKKFVYFVGLDRRNRTYYYKYEQKKIIKLIKGRRISEKQARIGIGKISRKRVIEKPRIAERPIVSGIVQIPYRKPPIDKWAVVKTKTATIIVGGFPRSMSDKDILEEVREGLEFNNGTYLDIIYEEFVESGKPPLFDHQYSRDSLKKGTEIKEEIKDKQRKL